MSLHLRSSIAEPQFAQVRMRRFGSGCGGSPREAGCSTRGGEGAAFIGDEDTRVGPRLASRSPQEV